MQIDMHYGAIYYLATLAKINENEAQIIAYASQFVDDAEFGGTVQFCDGDGCICSNSAHKYLSDNLSAHARLVWIPYHFIPEPTRQGTFLEKLKCVKDNNLARSAVDEAIKEKDDDIRPFRFGVALHAYADTWSHYDFSGIASDTNLVKNVRPLNVSQNSYEWCLTKVGNFAGWIRKKYMNPIGHLFAEHCPDVPYLEWQYTVVGSDRPAQKRVNLKDFQAALERIYAYMLEYAGAHSDAGIPEDHKKDFDRLLSAKEDNGKKRLAMWEQAYKDQFKKQMPEYKKGIWMNDSFGKAWKKDVCLCLDGTTCADFKKSNYWRFCQALSKHGIYVEDQLAAHDIRLM